MADNDVPLSRRAAEYLPAIERVVREEHRKAVTAQVALARERIEQRAADDAALDSAV